MPCRCFCSARRFRQATATRSKTTGHAVCVCVCVCRNTITLCLGMSLTEHTIRIQSQDAVIEMCVTMRESEKNCIVFARTIAAPVSKVPGGREMHADRQRANHNWANHIRQSIKAHRSCNRQKGISTYVCKYVCYIPPVLSMQRTMRGQSTHTHTMYRFPVFSRRVHQIPDVPIKPNRAICFTSISVRRFRISSWLDIACVLTFVAVLLFSISGAMIANCRIPSPSAIKHPDVALALTIPAAVFLSAALRDPAIADPAPPPFTNPPTRRKNPPPVAISSMMRNIS